MNKSKWSIKFGIISNLIRIETNTWTIFMSFRICFHATSPPCLFNYLGRPQAWDWNSKSLPKRYRTFWRMLPPLSFAQLRWHWPSVPDSSWALVTIGQSEAGTVTSDQWEARAGPGPLPSPITSCQHFPHWWQTPDTDHWPLPVTWEI